MLDSSYSAAPVLESMFEFSLTRCAYKSSATLSIICVVDSSLSLVDATATLEAAALAPACTAAVAAVVTSFCVPAAFCAPASSSAVLGTMVGFSFVFTSFAFANSFSKTRDPFDCPFSPRLNDWLSTSSKLGRLMLIFFVVSSTLLRT